MEKYDVAPDLYEAIMSDFNRRMAADKTIAYIVANGQTYVDASEYAVRVGEHLAAAFRNNLSSGVLPDGKMYYNIAERAVRPAIENNRLLVNGISEQVQRTLNESAGIGLAVQTPTPNTDRVDGIINRLTQAEQYDDAAWLLDEPIINISQSFVDDFIRTNAEFHAQSGLPAMITRTTSGECCDWCAELAGRYEYGSSTMPQDIFRRHERCRCMVLYDPADGRGYQNVHSKKWNAPEDVARIEERKKVGLHGADTLTGREKAAINRYVSSESYPLNAALRYGLDLDDDQMRMVQDLDSALLKMPMYQGTVYRSLDPSMIPDLDDFWRRYAPGNTVREFAYTSTSTGTYDDSMGIQLIIQSKTGRDIRIFNKRESEILLERNSDFLVERIEGDTIWLIQLD